MPIGCGEPMLSDIGVIKFKDHYSLYVGGKAKGLDAEVGTLLKENLTPEELYNTVDEVIAAYSQMGKKREPFFKFWKRVGRDQLIS